MNITLNTQRIAHQQAVLFSDFWKISCLFSGLFLVGHSSLFPLRLGKHHRAGGGGAECADKVAC